MKVHTTNSSDCFTVLAVCTGNICRSPLTEQLLRAGLTAWPDVIIASSGTSARAGEPMTQQAEQLSRQHGGDPSQHISRLLTPQQITSSNLILALSHEHRRAVVELVPLASRYTFTLVEFASLVVGITDHDLRQTSLRSPQERRGGLQELVETAGSRRGFVEPLTPPDSDVIDPFGRGDEVYRQSASQLVPAVGTALRQFSRAMALRRQ